MKNILLMVVMGIGLFLASAIGLLGLQGRLNHEGTKGIPLLHGLFPQDKEAEQAKKQAADGEGHEGHGADAGHGEKDDHGAEPNAAGHGESATEGENKPATAEKPLPYRKGTSVLTEPPKDGGGHGGGHGESKSESGHGDAAAHAAGDHAADGDHAASSHTAAGSGAPEAGKNQTAADREWARKRAAMENRHPYPQGLFSFATLEPDITPDQVNELVRRVNEKSKRLDAELAVARKMRHDLLTQLQDVKTRQAEVSKQMQRVVQEREKLNKRILEFEQNVLTLRQDEIAGLKQNAKNIEALEPATGRDLILSWWNSGKPGQERALKTLAVMTKEAVDAILAEMETDRIREILDRRLSIARTKESSK